MDTEVLSPAKNNTFHNVRPFTSHYPYLCVYISHLAFVLQEVL